MQSHLGLWIDRKKALIVTFGDEGEDLKRVNNSSSQKHVRFRGGARAKTPYGAQFFSAEDQRDRHFMEQLNKFYDEVIVYLRGVESIMIFGPGEAKLEFQKRLKTAFPNLNILVVETLDKMTDRQFAAKVRDRARAYAV
ncbi:MAG: hypothetical protein PHQ36_00510 [Anaerolineales bacterium]|nr:hypothetical protein [Anaerolineales bacterium]